MLTASVAYEVTRSLYQRLRGLEPDAVNALIDAMRAEAYGVVSKSAKGTPLSESRTAYMRYIGQGHEIAVALEVRPLALTDRTSLQEAFEREYRAQFGRIIPDLEAEVLSWALSMSAQVEAPAPAASAPAPRTPGPSGQRRVFDPASGELVNSAVYRRAELTPGVHIVGPALIVEDETTTVVSPAFSASVDVLGYLILERRQQKGRIR
jgi:N-methylhydantoinase A